ncbi:MULTISPECIES: FIST signal transduction protein [unclassified Tenacibaculum]|uniref:FIST signal transduction protein n=1 Tax=unclassified Tenacibaculum TaxID=2635139 RepID=UPI001F207DC2|nr:MULTISPECIES: FIST C-terminal domain-containing protein [unclassified Tenacibaculum]MCF2874360.1 FIST C-terminal domain-containing protein [Tenacibaculum sp. Cn5-1]MCF2934941.1 FIST C-terminal domain-containing protein [Tenacibaculum sp. Cn5-34]MCG7511151.1 FIST C-terminal domain-containing protein [Tenacibaculum sp. Cn5-46]
MLHLTTTNIDEITLEIKNLVKNNTALISIGEHTDINIDNLVSSLNEADINFIGGIFPMVIWKNDVQDKGIIVHELTNVVQTYTIRNISQKEFKIPKTNFKENTNYSLITFVDGLTSSISNYLSRLYQEYGMKTNYFGGGAGSLTLQQKPCVFSKEGFLEDTAVVAIIEMKSSIGVEHGWQKLDGPYIVTKTSGNSIEGINWDAPYDLYKKVVENDSGMKFSDTGFFELAMRYPLGVIKQGTDYIIRDPLSTDENDSLVCVGEVEENTMINIMKGDKEQLIKAARKAAESIADQAQKPKFAMVIDCISRILYLKDDFKHELENVSEAISNQHPTIPTCGALTLGEISSYGNGYIEFYNKTIVVGLFE